MTKTEANLREALDYIEKLLYELAEFYPGKLRRQVFDDRPMILGVREFLRKQREGGGGGK